MESKNMALDIMVVGLGQAGGKLAGEFHRRGYRVLAVNTAQTDLRSLGGGAHSDASVPEEHRLHVGLPGYDGAGDDPEFGRACIRENADLILDTVLDRAEGADMILVVSGLGGGTGSSLNELVNVLGDQELPVIAMATLPMRGENAIVKVNAVRAIQELAQSSARTIILIDNARADEMVRDVPMAEYYQHINALIVEPLDAINRLNTRGDLRALRSFDGEELRKMLLGGGVLNLGVAEVDGLNLDGLNDAVQHCLRSGDLMPAGFDPGHVSYLSVVIEAAEQTLARAPMSVIDNFHLHWKNATQGGAVEVGIYSAPHVSYPTRLRVLALSSALPREVQELVTEASREAVTVRNKLQQHIGGIDLAGLEGLEILPNITRGNAPRRPSTPARPSAPPPYVGREAGASVQTGLLPSQRVRGGEPSGAEQGQAVAPWKDAARSFPPEDAEAALGLRDTEGEDASSQDNQADLFGRGGQARVSSTPPPLPPTPPDVEAMHGPHVYEQLVEDYENTQSIHVREEIVDRLEHDRMSPYPSVRYHAVQAMVQLDPALFEGALLEASDDEHPAVSGLAREALQS